MNKLYETPQLGTLTEVSDNLITEQDYPCTDEKFLNFDKICDLKSKKFKKTDTILIYKKDYYLIEFKRCDLFYYDNEAIEDEKEKEKNFKIMNSIIKDVPQKLTDSLLYQLPSHFKNYNNAKVNFRLILGSKSKVPQNNAGRNRMCQLSSKEFKKLKKALYRYNETPYVTSVIIETKESFLDSKCLNNSFNQWEKG